MINNKEVTTNNHEGCNPTTSHSNPNSTEEKIPVRRVDTSCSLKSVTWCIPFEKLSFHSDILTTKQRETIRISQLGIIQKVEPLNGNMPNKKEWCIPSFPPNKPMRQQSKIGTAAIYNTMLCKKVAELILKVNFP